MAEGPAPKQKKLTDEDDQILPKYEVHYEEKSCIPKPLLFFFDMEATGLIPYSARITEIAGKVIGISPSCVSQQIFTSLVHTSCSIPREGIITNGPSISEELNLYVLNP